jgi:outer membrane protein assembly factor BamA
VHLRFEYTRANFLGGLRKLRLRLLPGYVVLPNIFDVQRRGPAAENDLTLTQPDLFGSNVQVHLLVGYDLGIAEAYQYHGPRAQVGLDRPFWRDRVLAGISWNLQYLDFFDVNEDIFNEASNRFFGFEDPYRLGYVEVFGQVDLRDQPLEPRSGGYFMVRVEEGRNWLASDFDYFKITPDARGYATITRRVVFAVRGLIGWLSPDAGQQSPITRRYYLGGPASHRGFSFGRLSPQVPDSQGQLFPVGGNGEFLISSELRIQVTKLGGNWLGIAPFFDAGDVTARFSDLELKNLNLATGAALQYLTPVGVVRAGLGIRLNRLGPGNPDPGDRVAFHISIGEAF